MRKGEATFQFTLPKLPFPSTAKKVKSLSLTWFKLLNGSWLNGLPSVSVVAFLPGPSLAFCAHKTGQSASTCTPKSMQNALSAHNMRITSNSKCSLRNILYCNILLWLTLHSTIYSSHTFVDFNERGIDCWLSWRALLDCSQERSCWVVLNSFVVHKEIGYGTSRPSSLILLKYKLGTKTGVLNIPWVILLGNHHQSLRLSLIKIKKIQPSMHKTPTIFHVLNSRLGQTEPNLMLNLPSWLKSESRDTWANSHHKCIKSKANASFSHPFTPKPNSQHCATANIGLTAVWKWYTVHNVHLCHILCQLTDRLQAFQWRGSSFQVRKHSVQTSLSQSMSSFSLVNCMN